MIGQSVNNLTSQEIEREKRIKKASETSQFHFAHSKISVCQNLRSQTEDCIASCKTINFSNNYKISKEISEHLDSPEQPVNKSQSSTTSTSYTPSTASDQTPEKKP